MTTACNVYGDDLQYPFNHHWEFVDVEKRWA